MPLLLTLRPTVPEKQPKKPSVRWRITHREGTFYVWSIAVFGVTVDGFCLSEIRQDWTEYRVLKLMRSAERKVKRGAKATGA